MSISGRMKTKKIYLDDRITEENIGEIKSYFDELKPPYEKVVLILRNNEGGDIAPVLELINEIRYSDIPVSINAQGYIMSAAAVLYFYLLLHEQEEEFSNVLICPLVSELLVIIHRPRKEEPDYVQFAEPVPESIGHASVPTKLSEKTRFVDDLFEDVMKLLGHVANPTPPTNSVLSEMTHVSEHIRKTYYANGDFVFKYDDKS